MSKAVNDDNKKEDELDKCKSDPSVIVEELLPLDDLFVTRAIPPVATVSWFEGNYVDAIKTLDTRLQAILKVNPWLAGKLVCSRKGRHNVVYSDTNPQYQYSVKDIFLVYKDSEVRSDMTVDEMSVEVQKAKPVPMVLSPGQDLQSPLIRLAVAPCEKEPNTKFALFLSLLHSVGDGHTFYQVLNMLLGSRPISALILKRIPHTQADQDAAMGKPESQFFDLPIFVCTIFRGIFGTNPASMGSKVYMVDRTKIEKMKEESKNNDVEFVSTNDIITSWALTNFGVNQGVMLVNFRDRLVGHTNDHVGNYENVIFYRSPEDTANPALIRKSLMTMKRVTSKDRPLSMVEDGGRTTLLVTNWSSFADAAGQDLPKCRQVASYPYFVAGFTLCTLPYCIIFEAKAGQTGIMLLGPASLLDNVEIPPFAATISIS